jgi:hypothetical protein
MDSPTLYEGTKRLLAWPMRKVDYCAHRGWIVPDDEDPKEAGYLVEYQDGGPAQAGVPTIHTGYISWSPASVFEAIYRPCETHIDRMKIERGQLEKRLHDLGAFIDSNPVFETLTSRDRELMTRQRQFMSSYLDVLTERAEPSGLVEA